MCVSLFHFTGAMMEDYVRRRNAALAVYSQSQVHHHVTQMDLQRYLRFLFPLLLQTPSLLTRHFKQITTLEGDKLNVNHCITLSSPLQFSSDPLLDTASLCLSLH